MDKDGLKELIYDLRRLDRKARKEYGLRVLCSYTDFKELEDEKSEETRFLINPHTVDLRDCSFEATTIRSKRKPKENPESRFESLFVYNMEDDVQYNVSSDLTRLLKG